MGQPFVLGASGARPLARPDDEDGGHDDGPQCPRREPRPSPPPRRPEKAVAQHRHRDPGHRRGDHQPEGIDRQRMRGQRLGPHGAEDLAFDHLDRHREEQERGHRHFGRGPMAHQERQGQQHRRQHEVVGVHDPGEVERGEERGAARGEGRGQRPSPEDEAQEQETQGNEQHVEESEGERIAKARHRAADDQEVREAEAGSASERIAVASGQAHVVRDDVRAKRARIQRRDRDHDGHHHRRHRGHGPCHAGEPGPREQLTQGPSAGEMSEEERREGPGELLGRAREAQDEPGHDGAIAPNEYHRPEKKRPHDEVVGAEDLVPVDEGVHEDGRGRGQTCVR